MELKEVMAKPCIPFNIGGRVFDLSSQFLIMGIINMTPDSFYDGGRYSLIDKALSRVEQMIKDGANIIDVGGESSRPGSLPISSSEEIQRTVPLIRAIKSRFDIPVTLDTYKWEVLKAGLDAGIDGINDIYALSYSLEYAQEAAASQLPVILMHMQGEPKNMQNEPKYHDILQEMKDFFLERRNFFCSLGGKAYNVIMDPGIGFGKTYHHNLTLLRHLEEIRPGTSPILVGLSRKSLFQTMLGKPVHERLIGSVVLGVLACTKGANILRVHDVAETADALKVLHTWNHEMEKKVYEVG